MTIDNTAPVISITGPAAGASVQGTVTVAGNASDAVGVTRVEFYVDGNLIGTDFTAPCAVSWNTATATAGRLSGDSHAPRRIRARAGTTP